MNSSNNLRWDPERSIPAGVTIAEKNMPEPGYTDFSESTITLSSNLTDAERRTVLAHELTHWDRGAVPEDPLLYLLEEITVDQESMRKLIPLPDLIDTIAVTTRPDLMAAHLGVTIDGLFTRLEALAADERSQIIDIARRKENNAEVHHCTHRRSHR